MILASGLNFGVPRSVPHLLGICSGVPVMILIFGLGLDKVFQWWPASFLILRVIGGLYLLYLAFKIATMTVNTADKAREQPLSFIQAALFQWVNPKAWVMCLSAIPAFTSTTKPMLPQVAVIAATFCVIGLASVGSWLVAGSQLQVLLTRPRQQRVFNVTMGALLVVSIIPMVQI
jgi:threonine/homoserine/homoserine lactone efflux protein